MAGLKEALWASEIEGMPMKRFALLGYRSPTVKILSLERQTQEAELFNDGPVDKVIFSVDGRFLAALRDEWVHVWEMGTWREIARLRHKRKILGADFVAGGSRLATVSDDLTARVWILGRAELIARACGALTHNLSPEPWRRNFGEEIYRETCPNLPAMN